MKYSMMSIPVALIAALMGSSSSVMGFTMTKNTVSSSLLSSRSSALNAVELVAEPEGGDELDAVVPMTNTRMKNMGTADDDSTSEDGLPIYKFWLTSEADGTYIKEVRTKVLKDASKKANFPGFRKGQIPPYAQPQMTMFAIQESIIKTCESSVDAFGLKSLPGSEGSVEVLEDVKQMSNGYKTGETLQFTATFKATFDPEKQPKEEETTEETATTEDETVTSD